MLGRKELINQLYNFREDRSNGISTFLGKERGIGSKKDNEVDVIIYIYIYQQL